MNIKCVYLSVEKNNLATINTQKTAIKIQFSAIQHNKRLHSRLFGDNRYFKYPDHHLLTISRTLPSKKELKKAWRFITALNQPKYSPGTCIHYRY